MKASLVGVPGRSISVERVWRGGGIGSDTFEPLVSEAILLDSCARSRCKHAVGARKARRRLRSSQL